MSDNRYIILRFGSRRVLLESHNGQSATMTHHADGYLTFDYSSCNVLGMIEVAEGQDEPTPSDFFGISIDEFRDIAREHGYLAASSGVPDFKPVSIKVRRRLC